MQDRLILGASTCRYHFVQFWKPHSLNSTKVLTLTGMPLVLPLYELAWKENVLPRALELPAQALGIAALAGCSARSGKPLLLSRMKNIEEECVFYSFGVECRDDFGVQKIDPNVTIVARVCIFERILERSPSPIGELCTHPFSCQRSSSNS